MASQSFVLDLKGVLTGHVDAFKRVSKNPKYFPVAVLIIALVAGARFLQQWQVSEQLRELSGFGLDMNFMIKQAVFGFVMSFVVLFFVHLSAVKWFKGTAIDLKGFISTYAFLSVPMLLSAIPVPLVGLFGLVWMVVLFFKMMKAFFGFGFWKALLVAFCGTLVAVIIGGIIGSLIGLGGYSSGFNTGGDFKFDFGGDF